MLKIGDKVKYVKSKPFMEIPIGTIFEVTDIKGTALAVKGEYKSNGMIVGHIEGIMSYDEYEKYFEKVVEETNAKKKNSWTEYRLISDVELSKILGNLGDYFIRDFATTFLLMTDNKITTRNNGKKTELRVEFKISNTTRKIKATSCCNKIDRYDETKGVEVALIKLFAKIIPILTKNYIEKNY